MEPAPNQAVTLRTDMSLALAYGRAGFAAVFYDSDSPLDGGCLLRLSSAKAVTDTFRFLATDDQLLAAEGYALWRALQIARDNGWTVTACRTDCKRMPDLIYGVMKPWSLFSKRFAALFHRELALSGDPPILWCPREENETANNLAQNALCGAGICRWWFEEGKE